MCVCVCACICVFTCTHTGKYILKRNVEVAKQSPGGRPWGLLILSSHNYIFHLKQFPVKFPLVEVPSEAHLTWKMVGMRL